MTPPPTAKCAYLTEPQAGVPILNIVVADGEDPVCVELTLQQLAGLVADGAAMSARREAQR